MKSTITLIAALLLAALPTLQAADEPSKPNIVIILADDLDYGDVGCYGATKIKTPNIDRLAREGMKFTDAHTAASVCSPSRYGLMTGRSPWRLHKKGNGYSLRLAGVVVAGGVICSRLGCRLDTAIVLRFGVGVAALAAAIDWVLVLNDAAKKYPVPGSKVWK